MIVMVSKNSQVTSPPTIGRHVKVLHNKIAMKIQHQSYHEIELCSKEIETTVGPLPCPQSNLTYSTLHPRIYETDLENLPDDNLHSISSALGSCLMQNLKAKQVDLREKPHHPLTY